MKSGQTRSRIEAVRIDTLRVPEAGKAQRPFRPSKGNSMAAEFDINSFGFPVVCRVEETNRLLDGQHRVYAIQKSGYAQPTDSIECEVYERLTMAEMARMFLGRNRSTPVTAFERFRVAVTAGFPAETAITEIVEGLGLKIGHARTEGKIHAVAALRRVYGRHGPDTLERVLRVLRDAYDRSAAGFGQQLIDGLGLVLATYKRIDDKQLVKALSSEPHGVHALQRRAEAYRERLGRVMPECTAASLVDIYNRHVGRKRVLVKWWKAFHGGRLHRSRRFE